MEKGRIGRLPDTKYSVVHDVNCVSIINVSIILPQDLGSKENWPSRNLDLEQRESPHFSHIFNFLPNKITIYKTRAFRFIQLHSFEQQFTIIFFKIPRTECLKFVDNPYFRKLFH